MATRRLRSPATAALPGASPVNEWGVYDPAVAGIEALFARLDPDGTRLERLPPPRIRRRTRRKSKGADVSGVGLAIAEAIERARQQTSGVSTQIERLLPAPPRESAGPARPQRWSRPAIWIRAAAEPVRSGVKEDGVHGIFGTLLIPPTVALVQYARGCRIGRIRIAAEPG